MALPTYNSTGQAAGATDAGGAWTYTCSTSPGAGSIVVVHIVQDGTATGNVTVTGGTNIENLAGTDNAWTQVAVDQVIGSPTAALAHVYIGRTLSASTPTISGGNSGTDDIFIRSYRFENVNPGTTLADVIENGSAGAIVNGFGTGATVSDTGVTTLGADRKALNLIGVNNASTIVAFTGETGGDWGETTLEYSTTSGTDAMLSCQDADMASAGTVNGGTAAITSSSWGVIGFALIGTAPAAPFIDDTIQTELQAVMTSAVSF